VDALTHRFAADSAELADLPSATGLTAWLHGAGTDPICAALAAAVSVLLSRHLRFDAADPHWPDRDRIAASQALEPLCRRAATLAGAGCAVILPDPPGQALGAAVGMAMAERTLAARFGRSLVDHRTWLLASPDELASGLAQEAAAAAGALRLGRLTVFAAWPEAEPPPAAFTTGWTIRRAAAGDEAALHGAMSAALRSQKPTLIACTGRIDAPAQASPAAVCPVTLGGRGAGARRAWLRRLTRHGAREEFDRTLACRLPPAWHRGFSEPGSAPVPGRADSAPALVSRQAFAKLSLVLPELVCLPPDGPAGAQALWQANVQAMACAASGMARHGGIIPVTHSRLCSVESLAPALRTAAEAGLRVIHVVAEPANPCPTAGYRAGLRAMRNVFVFRPADASETLECAELALRRSHGPSVLLLSDIVCAPMTDQPTRTRCVHGGFLVHEPSGRRDATLIASGADLPVVLRARAQLSRAGMSIAVVSLPCWELFANQDQAWRDQVLGSAPRIGVEAGSGFGWERWLGTAGRFLGSDSGPITEALIVSAVESAVGWTRSTKAPLQRRREGKKGLLF
jgi:transketolase